MSGRAQPSCPLAEFLSFPSNTRWYAEHWLQRGDVHPQEHWVIRERLDPWRRRVAAAEVGCTKRCSLKFHRSRCQCAQRRARALQCLWGPRRAPLVSETGSPGVPVPLGFPNARKSLKRRGNPSPHPGVPGVPTIAERSPAAQAVGHRSVGWLGELPGELRDPSAWLVLSIVIA
jgi:hypothetical protein